MQDEDRRRFMLAAGALVLSGCAKATDARGTTLTSAEHEEDVSPAEDLMREHGVLNRILLVYEEGVRRLGRDGEAAAPATMEGIAAGAEIISRFVEQYHEKLEEDFLFPRFEKAGKLVDLVGTLRRQHRAGRALTDTIRRLANPTAASDPAARQKLAETMQLFVRMYRPHEAREDTVLFPALPSVIRPKELEELGEQFEKKEHELFGKEGFEGIVEQVAHIERALGVHDLNQFTPPT